MEINKIYNGDCLELMKDIDNQSIDMILCDLPYGTTYCKWDTIIPFEPLWNQYERIIKDNGAIILTASQPFTSKLIMSNINLFKYEWIWKKSNGGGFLSANKLPLKRHENIIVFYKKQPIYNPQKTIGTPYTKKSKSCGSYLRDDTNEKYSGWVTKNDGSRYPISVLDFKNEMGLHPTQKPVALFEYLIRTYTNEQCLVLDNCAGSGTTAIACLKSNRNFICMEKEKTYFDIANKRIEEELNVTKFFLVK